MSGKETGGCWRSSSEVARASNVNRSRKGENHSGEKTKDMRKWSRGNGHRKEGLKKDMTEHAVLRHQEGENTSDGIRREGWA